MHSGSLNELQVISVHPPFKVQCSFPFEVPCSFPPAPKIPVFVFSPYNRFKHDFPFVRLRNGPHLTAVGCRYEDSEQNMESASTDFKY